MFKDLLPKIIYFFIMPCSKATLEMEKERGGRLSLFENLHLKFHLIFCDFCKVYKRKLEAIDNQLEKRAKESKIQNTDIQNFIKETKNKIEKS